MSKKKYEEYEVESAARSLKEAQSIMTDAKLAALAKKKLLKDAEEAVKAAKKVSGEDNIKAAYTKFKHGSLAEAATESEGDK